MSKQVVNNGGFDNDPSAEKIRLAFEKVKANFDEIYTTLPQVDPATLSGQNGKILVVNAGGNAFILADANGMGDLLAANNLSDINEPNQARLNLGLGSAAVAILIDEDDMVSDLATAVPSQQSVKAYVDGRVLNYQAGAGIAIQTTPPFSTSSPGIVNNQTNVNVSSASYSPASGVLTLNLSNGGTVTVDLSPYTVLKIDGYQVDKGTGNVDYANWEVGDFGQGWDKANNRIVAFKVNTLPVVSAGVLQDANLSFATDNAIL